MGTLSAEIVIGTGHPNDGGLIKRSIKERIQVTEGDKVSLVIDRGSSRSFRDCWLTFPSSIRTIGDCICILIWFIIASRTDTSLSARRFSKLHSLYFGHLESFPKADLEQFYDEAHIWSVSQRRKIIISIYEDSVLADQIDAFERFGLDFEILKPVHSRLYSRWTKNHVIRKHNTCQQDIHEVST